MLQNARAGTFTVSELLMENQQGHKITPPLPRLGLSPHYNRSNSLLFVNATKIYQLKAK